MVNSRRIDHPEDHPSVVRLLVRQMAHQMVNQVAVVTTAVEMHRWTEASHHMEVGYQMVDVELLHPLLILVLDDCGSRCPTDFLGINKTSAAQNGS